MDDSLLVKELEALEQGVGKPPNQRNTEPLEVVLLYQLIEVHALWAGQGAGRVNN